MKGKMPTLFHERNHFMKKNLISGKKPVTMLLMLYSATVLVRFLLALVTSMYPTVEIDEFLYYNLARSIATEGKLLFRGQPADYSFILYPLVLSPVYLLFGAGANYFRLIQLWNILIMSASVFPIFGLCRGITKDEMKSYGLTLIFLLLPDFILGQLIYSEALIYPLFYTLLYCAWRYNSKKEEKQLLLLGLLGALLYFTKPGAILPALIFLGAFLIKAIREKKKKALLFSLAGFGVLAGVIIALQCLVVYGFGLETGLLSLYEQQVTVSSGLHLDQFFRAVVLYPFYFMLACGLIAFIYPFTVCKLWSRENRFFGLMLLLCLGGMIIGTAWSINRYEFKTDTIHLRYIAMYVPLMLLMCHVPEENAPAKPGQKKMPLAVPVMLGFAALCTLIFGSDGGAGHSDCYPFMALSALLAGGKKTAAVRWALNILILLCCGGAFYVLTNPKCRKSIHRITAGAMAIVMLISGFFSYHFFAGKINREVAQSSGNVVQNIGEADYLYIYTDQTVMNHILDVNTRQNANFVALNILSNELLETDGVYRPFLPKETRGNQAKLLTPDTDTLVMDFTAFDLVKLSKHARAEDYNALKIVRFTPGENLFDSIISNVHKQILSPSVTGILLVFGEEYLKGPVRIRFDIESDTEQTFSIFNTRKLHQIPLEKGRSWYEVTFDKPEDAYNFKVDQQNIRLHEYQMLPLS